MPRAGPGELALRGWWHAAARQTTISLPLSGLLSHEQRGWPSGICGQTDGHQLGAQEDDGMRLVAKAVLWLHSTLYRLTNGRIGGRFIAGSPILLSRPSGGGPASSGPDRWPTSATATASCCVPPTAAPLGILAGTTTCARPAGPRSRSAPSTLSSAPRPLIPPSAASCSLALSDVQGLRPRPSAAPGDADRPRPPPVALTARR
jgi:hypothetical protein